MASIRAVVLRAANIALAVLPSARACLALLAGDAWRLLLHTRARMQGWAGTIPLMAMATLGTAHAETIMDKPNSDRMHMSAPPSPDASQDCEAKLKDFVAELDKILASDSHAVDPLQALLKKVFPLHGCDIEKAIAICKQSKFFLNVSEEPKSYSIAFSSAGHRDPYPGFQVIFALLKESGNSWLPFAQVNSW